MNNIEKKAEGMKELLECLIDHILPSGNITVCSSCRDEKVCNSLKKAIKKKIKKIYV